MHIERKKVWMPAHLDKTGKYSNDIVYYFWFLLFLFRGKTISDFELNIELNRIYSISHLFEKNHVTFWLQKESV